MLVIDYLLFCCEFFAYEEIYNTNICRDNMNTDVASVFSCMSEANEQKPPVGWAFANRKYIFSAVKKYLPLS